MASELILHTKTPENAPTTPSQECGLIGSASGATLPASHAGNLAEAAFARNWAATD
jgi:hypothetical protein